jgi:hypothetical protein
MILLVTEASKSRLLGQRPLSCKTLLIPATGSLQLDHPSNMNGMQEQNSRVPLHFCSLCHLYKKCTLATGEVKRSLLRKDRCPYSISDTLFKRTKQTDEMLTAASAVHTDCHNTETCFHLCEGVSCGTPSGTGDT